MDNKTIQYPIFQCTECFALRLTRFICDKCDNKLFTLIDQEDMAEAEQLAKSNKSVELKTWDYDDGQIILGDNLDWMRAMPDDSVDLIFGSPPYENIRSYGIDFDLTGQDWVDWMMIRWAEMQRISKGLVAMVVEGKTEDFDYSATPMFLITDLKRAGYKVRKPILYQRHGIPGTGGPDWFRNVYEFTVCTSKGRLPWSDNKSCGTPPIYDVKTNTASPRMRDGKRVPSTWIPNDITVPGNIIDCGCVGGYNMGSAIAHENEAPFPEKLVKRFVLSFCPKGGTVLDPFSGSGTTVSVARQHRRKFIGIDIRESQTKLTRDRLEQARLRQGFDLEI